MSTIVILNLVYFLVRFPNLAYKYYYKSLITEKKYKFYNKQGKIGIMPDFNTTK